jgi:TetR/AcrR family transcriptional regulator
MVTKARNPDRTRRAILDAAIAEFCAMGPAGARIDAIAAAAGVNKRMLYHYFSSKDGLFAAVLDDQLSSQPALAPTSLVDRHADASGRTDWIRLLMWQALAGETRSTNAARAGVSQTLETTPRSDRQSVELDAAQLELTRLAIALFPFAFPQLTRLITGMAPDDADFRAARSAFLAALEARIEHAPRAVAAPKPRFRLTAHVTEPPSRPRGE